MSKRIPVLLALLPLCDWIGCSSQPGLSPGDAGFVQWIGLDSRPLAVGSHLIVTLEIATDGGLAPGYTIASSDPRVVAIQDAGSQRLLLDVRGAGSTTLELQTSGERADVSVTASIPVGLELWDAEHLAAGIGDGGLDAIFYILSSSEEVVQAVVLDASGRRLNSWGLVEGHGVGQCLLASKREPEQFILANSAALSGCTFNVGLIDAGLQPEDAGPPPEDAGADSGPSSSASSTLSYVVNSSTSANAVRIQRGGPTQLSFLAEAMTGADSDSSEVFGVEDWVFSCYPPDSCTMNRLSPSVVSLSIQAGTGMHDVFVSSASQGLMKSLTIGP